MKKKISLLGISGSLRNSSANTAILRAIGQLLPPHVDFKIYEGLDLLPHFSPERNETQDVISFKKQLSDASGLILCTPEYAFGVPGVLKNALDWTVSSGDLNQKPVAVISASPLNSGGDKALASLLLTLTALGTIRNEHTAISIPNVKNKLDGNGKLTDEPTSAHLQAVADHLLKIID